MVADITVFNPDTITDNATYNVNFENAACSVSGMIL